MDFWSDLALKSLHCQNLIYDEILFLESPFTKNFVRHALRQIIIYVQLNRN